MTSASDHFDYLSDLGRPSAHAYVARMRDRATGREYAVKMARPGASTRRFQREIEAMISAAGYHVMPVAMSDADHEWYAMPIAQRELTDELARIGIGGADRHSLALDVAQSVADALRDFHASGQAHRDLKPQNILWLEDAGGARWVVSDFGVARNKPGATTSPLTFDGSLVGTEGWAAPEQYRAAHSVRATCDVYSLGAIVAWILTGEVPSIAEVPLPEGPLRACIARATRHLADRRYPDLDEFLRALAGAVRSGGAGPMWRQLEAVLGPPIDYERLSDLAMAWREDEDLMLGGMPQLQQKELHGWARADPDALRAVASAVSEMLRNGRRAGLSQSELCAPLRLVVGSLRALLVSGNDDFAEQVAPACFEALEVCDQWDVSREAARWLKELGDRDAQSMISALDASTATSYIRGFLEDDWSTPKSTVLRRWLT